MEGERASLRGSQLGSGARDTLLAFPPGQHLVLVERQRIPIAVQDGFGGIGPLIDQRARRLGRIDQEARIPALQLPFTQGDPVRPETVAPQGRRFRRMRGAKPFPDLVLREVIDALLEVEIAPGPAAAGPQQEAEQQRETPPAQDGVRQTAERGTGGVGHGGLYATPTTPSPATFAWSNVGPTTMTLRPSYPPIQQKPI